MNVGQTVDLTATELAFGGPAVGRGPDGRIVFVPFLAPGDSARVKIEHVRSNHARGHVLELTNPGPARVTPPCPVFGVCGGCQWQHVALPVQREAKERIVRHLLAPLGLEGRVQPLQGVSAGYAYRNRLILPVRAGPHGLRAGFFKGQTHTVVETESCAVQRPALWEAAREALALLRAAGCSGYDESSGKGQLRALLVRSAAGTGELGVVLVTAQKEFPAGRKFARELVTRVPAVVGVAQNVNVQRTNVILGPRLHMLAGRGYLQETLAGLNFRASLLAFFQANAEVTELMLQLVQAWAGAESGGVLDLYCGVGILGLSAAASSPPAWLVGVEESPAAVADARVNAKTVPGLKVLFETGAVEKVLPRLERNLAGLKTIIVDPPRKGLSVPALRAIVRLPARQLVYVSCDPATFARDLKGLLAAGYRLETVVPLDMFPQTYHIETVARLKR